MRAGSPVQPASHAFEQALCFGPDPVPGDRDDLAVGIEEDRQAIALPRRHAGLLEQVAQLTAVRAVGQAQAFTAAAEAHVQTG